MSLRRSISTMFGLMAALSFAAALSLLALTNYLHRSADEVANVLQSIRQVQQLELDLVAHAHATDQKKRAWAETHLRYNMAGMDRYIGSDTERRAYRNARRKLEIYFRDQPAQAASGETPEFEDAFSALRTLLDINAAEAAHIETQSTHWNAVVDRVILLAAFGTVVGMLVALVWLWRVAFRPVLSILRAMTSFAAGNRIARASERGPDELRSIAIQFNRMADALSRQYENQLVFLTGIAHDLRNPLFPIKMAASVASPDQPLPPDDKVRSMLSIVKRQVDRLDRMIGDLLDASRIEAGKLELRVESQDARSLAREVANLFEAASSKHRIELQIPEAPVPLYCDAFRIEQVLNNLVSNAIKYSPNGGRVQIGVESDSGCAVFKVTDEGMGIRDEDRPLVFEPFRRIRSADREIPGTGLGLSVARRIVEAHKGRLDLKSEFGKGSTFIVCIPANAAVSAEAA